eukprot:CAMPEP_0194159890 /NCGR_PEP_ID=MMETSP0152-20130528/78086_1 /TAXON_ID=1049557 /ORGANISM="Thalassiothrix antarctica, Strain L6-D1" /LENGTH=1362 /DNA_ID=CAMNT_0038869519 /DNA_START=72 /DNA_END=4160 /DNA_ORIENTATION=+
MVMDINNEQRVRSIFPAGHPLIESNSKSIDESAKRRDVSQVNLRSDDACNVGESTGNEMLTDEMSGKNVTEIETKESKNLGKSCFPKGHPLGPGGGGHPALKGLDFALQHKKVKAGGGNITEIETKESKNLGKSCFPKGHPLGPGGGGHPALKGLDFALQFKKVKSGEGKTSGSRRNIGGKKTDATRRKKIHLSSIDPEKIMAGSLWHSTKDSVDFEQLDYDATEFETLFTESKREIIKVRRNQSALRKKNYAPIIDVKRSMNGGISLARVKMSYNKIADIVDTLEVTVFNATQLKSMKTFLPTDDERRLLIEYLRKGEGSLNEMSKIMSLLPECEKYMIAVMGIKNAESKIEAMLFRIQFQGRFDEVIKGIKTVKTACDEVRSSTRLGRVMTMILSLVNKINAGGNAQGKRLMGFNIESLLKLGRAKCFDKTTSILEYLIRLMWKNDEELIHFYKETPTVPEAERVIFDEIINGLDEELEKVTETAVFHADALQLSGNIISLSDVEFDANTDVAKKNGSSECNSDGECIERKIKPRTSMEAFVWEAAEQVNTALKDIGNLQVNYLSVLKYFGEDEMMQSHEFFGTLNKFINEFKLISQKVEKEMSKLKRSNFSKSRLSVVHSKSLIGIHQIKQEKDSSTPIKVSNTGSTKNKEAVDFLTTAAFATLKEENTSASNVKQKDQTKNVMDEASEFISQELKSKTAAAEVTAEKIATSEHKRLDSSSIKNIATNEMKLTNIKLDIDLPDEVESHPSVPSRSIRDSEKVSSINNTMIAAIAAARNSKDDLFDKEDKDVESLSTQNTIVSSTIAQPQSSPTLAAAASKIIRRLNISDTEMSATHSTVDTIITEEELFQYVSSKVEDCTAVSEINSMQNNVQKSEGLHSRLGLYTEYYNEELLPTQSNVQRHNSAAVDNTIRNGMKLSVADQSCGMDATNEVIFDGGRLKEHSTSDLTASSSLVFAEVPPLSKKDNTLESNIYWDRSESNKLIKPESNRDIHRTSSTNKSVIAAIEAARKMKNASFGEEDDEEDVELLSTHSKCTVATVAESQSSSLSAATTKIIRRMNTSATEMSVTHSKVATIMPEGQIQTTTQKAEEYTTGTGYDNKTPKIEFNGRNNYLAVDDNTPRNREKSKVIDQNCEIVVTKQKNIDRQEQKERYSAELAALSAMISAEVMAISKTSNTTKFNSFREAISAARKIQRNPREEDVESLSTHSSATISTVPESPTSSTLVAAARSLRRQKNPHSTMAATIAAVRENAGKIRDDTISTSVNGNGPGKFAKALREARLLREYGNKKRRMPSIARKQQPPDYDTYKVSSLIAAAKATKVMKKLKRQSSLRLEVVPAKKEMQKNSEENSEKRYYEVG